MKLDLQGEQKLDVTQQRLWEALNNPRVLEKCVPGCKEMIEIGPDSYVAVVELKVAAVGGSFEGKVSLQDKEEPTRCRLQVSGEGTLGQGNGWAVFEIVPESPETMLLKYEGEGDVGGLVAGVGQRVLKGVVKHLIKQFFTSLREELASQAAA
jgi:uncharacterized protein